MIDNNKLDNTVEELDSAAEQVFRQLDDLYPDDPTQRQHHLSELHTLWGIK